MSTYQIKYGDSLSSIARSAGMSTQDILRLNPSISDPNKIYAGRTLNLSATPAPAPTGPSEALKDLSIKNSPTIKEVASRVPDFVEDPTLTKLGKTYKTESTGVVDENKIRKETRNRFQGQIDAINQIYEGKRAEARVQGQARQGTTNAINARSGLLGSDFGVANTNNTEAYTNEIIGTIDAERGGKINEIYGLINTDSAKRVAEKRAAIEAGATKYLEYLSTTSAKKKEAATNIAKALFAKGIDPATLTAEEMSKITTSYGMTGEEFSNIYNDTKTAAEAAKAKADADALKANSFDLSEGQARYVYDPKTGETKLVAEKKKTYAPKAAGAGGIGTGAGGVYGSDLDAIIGATLSSIPSKFGQSTFQSQMNKARNDGDKINLIATTVLKGQPAELKADFANQAIGIREIDKAIAELDAGVKTGYLQDKAQYAANFFGRDYDPKLAKINAHLTAAIQPYRNSVTGAAWGTQEDGEYASLFGSTKYSPTELKQRLVNVKEVLKSKSSQGLNTFVNPMGYYDNQFDSGNFAPEGGARAKAEAAGLDYDSMKADGLTDEQINASL